MTKERLKAMSDEELYLLVDRTVNRLEQLESIGEKTIAIGKEIRECQNLCARIFDVHFG